MRERNHLEELGVDGRIILKWIFRKCDRSLDWTDLVQNRNRSRFLANAVKNLRVPYNAGNILTSRRMVSFSRTTLLSGVT